MLKKTQLLVIIVLLSGLSLSEATCVNNSDMSLAIAEATTPIISDSDMSTRISLNYT